MCIKTFVDQHCQYGIVVYEFFRLYTVCFKVVSCTNASSSLYSDYRIKGRGEKTAVRSFWRRSASWRPGGIPCRTSSSCKYSEWNGVSWVALAEVPFDYWLLIVTVEFSLALLREHTKRVKVWHTCHGRPWLWTLRAGKNSWASMMARASGGTPWGRWGISCAWYCLGRSRGDDESGARRGKTR